MKELTNDTIDWNQKCWRYFQLDKFIDSLREGNIYFAAANQFEDKFEGAVCIEPKNENHELPSPAFDMINRAFQGLKRLTKINCWHKENYENDAMWKLYSNDKKGIAITTTPQKMSVALKPYRLKPEYGVEDLYIGNVEYVDLSTHYVETTMLNVFFHKHIIYSYENEIRLAISLRQAEEFGVKVPELGIFVQVDYSQLIDEIIIGPNINSEDRETLFNVVRESGLESRIKDSCLLYKPRYI